VSDKEGNCLPCVMAAASRDNMIACTGLKPNRTSLNNLAIALSVGGPPPGLLDGT